ncbi:MAG: DNA-binding protein [Deltaproteobacteria bacterium]|nr:MAG: DNA-binding protein [Deltaproteobacteria bacterium]
MKQLLTLAEVAEKLNVGKSWVYQRTTKGKIPHIKVGRFCRFRWSEVWAWLQEQNSTGGGK